MPLLECIGLVKDYPGGKRAVDGVDFCVEQGEIVGLLGPNGAGKTTTFRMACGLIAPTKGRVILNGRDVTHWPMYRRARLGMGFLPQDDSAFKKLTVEQNLLAILEFMPLNRKERFRRIDELLAQFGLQDKRKQLAGTLSGGERRRLEISRCLASRPSLILLDEPFTGIDPVTINSIQDIITDLRASGISILLTDHRERETLTITDRSCIVCGGKILVSGDAETVLNDPMAQKMYFGTRFDASSIIEGKEAYTGDSAARNKRSRTSPAPDANPAPPEELPPAAPPQPDASPRPRPMESTAPAPPPQIVPRAEPVAENSATEAVPAQAAPIHPDVIPGSSLERLLTAYRKHGPQGLAQQLQQDEQRRRGDHAA